MNVQETEKKLGLRFREFEKHAISPSQMLADVKAEIQGLGEEQVERAKDEVFNRIISLGPGEGYPVVYDDRNNAKARDLVLFTVFPILIAFQRETGRKVHLQRGDRRVGDTISANFVGFGDRKYVFLVEATKSSIGQARSACMLALKEMGDNNPGGVLYGLVASGDFWQIIRYQREVFTQTDPVQVGFHTMKRDKAKWLKESSIIVDFLHAALRSEGFVAA